ncbi:MAG: metallopeptidase TldD-related protein [Erysipelotrichaceae bacterium]|nr:metallopeptidase TldD-related protein [Erysipelotrichaceae bacterium]
MIKKDIIKCLKANKDVTGYEIKIIDKDSRELFYVLNHLEINRAVKTKVTTVTVYNSDGKTTGSSTFAINAADSISSLKGKIKAAIKMAKSSRNQYYPLVDKKVNIKESKPKIANLNDTACDIARAVFKANIYKDGWINSTEIFVSAFKNEFINSNGVNHVSYSYKVQIEVIPTWSNSKKEEFELYKFYESNEVNLNNITNEVDEILNLAKARSIAVKPSEVKIPKNVPVLIKNDMRDLLVKYIAKELNYQTIYLKYNHYSLNDVLSKNPFDLTMKGSIKGCIDSAKYDNNGIVLPSKTIVKAGVAKAIYGSKRFGYYLNQKNITGLFPVCELKAKGIDYQNKKHIIIETFSSPQLEDNSGYWGGEVRLARYFDGKKYIPLTNFSISGDFFKDLKTVEFSKEITTSNSYKGPKYLIFKGIKIY